MYADFHGFLNNVYVLQGALINVGTTPLWRSWRETISLAPMQDPITDQAELKRVR